MLNAKKFFSQIFLTFSGKKYRPMSEEKKPLFNEGSFNRIQEIEKERKLKATFLEAIEKNKEINEYLLQYSPNSWDSFKKIFVELKVEHELYKDYYFKKKEEIDLLFVKDTKEILWIIQQKKLFDKQCLWHAGEVEIPEVLISHDFEFWSMNIKNCSFIELITDDEVALLKEYILSPSFEDEYLSWYGWQDYDNFKKEHLGESESSSMPEWYHFMNLRQGTSTLMLLPDIKSEEEEKCIRAGIDSMSQDERNTLLDKAFKKDDIDPNMEATEDDPLPERIDYSKYQDARPYLFFSSEDLDKFVNEFEDNEMKEMHQTKKNLNHNTKIDKWDLLDFNDAKHFLRFAGNKYPMQPYHCWRKGTIRLYQQFRKEKIIEALPMVFEEYQMRNSMGIAQHITNKELDEIQQTDKRIELYRNFYRIGKQILQGK